MSSAELSVPSETFKKPMFQSPSVEPKENLTTKNIPPAKEQTSQPLKKDKIDVPLPYKEPEWGGIPPPGYSFEIIKNGTFLSTLDARASSLVLGRLEVCDVVFQHPSVSRYHAVVQYCKGDDTHPKGFYVIDLGSTHGTRLNKERLTPNIHYKLKVGYVLQIGGSSRLYIFQGPDEEDEIKEVAPPTNDIKASNDTCTWGMAEDADEEEDLTENPFALSTPNEDLYIEDPKKTLRGWFEREGYELEYSVEEKGFKTFLCTVKLPVDTPTGEYLSVEASVSGKKKESVVACALEACRTLDGMGLLRQSNQESRQRKRKKWEENDFYDSDEDTFYDRTGEIEKRREMRKRMSDKKFEAESYESLKAKMDTLVAEIEASQKKLSTYTGKTSEISDSGADPLESYMSSLVHSSDAVTDKFEIRKLKVGLVKAEKEKAQLEKLLNIAKPTTLPPIVAPSISNKRLKSRYGFGLNKPKQTVVPTKSDENVEEVDSDEEPKQESNVQCDSDLKVNPTHVDTDKNISPACLGVDKPHQIEITEKDGKQKQYGPICDNYDAKLNVIGEGTNKLDKIKFSDDEEIRPKKYGLTFAIAEAVKICNKELETSDHPVGKLDTTSEDNRMEDSAQNREPKETSDKKPKKRHKKDLTNVDVYKSANSDYSTWVPPSNQSGDGMTHLNAKYGY